MKRNWFFSSTGQAILSQVLPTLEAKQPTPPSQVKSSVKATTNTTSSVSPLSTPSNQMNLTSKMAVPSTVIHHGAPPGKLPIPATPASQAIPTQIQVTPITILTDWCLDHTQYE